MTWEAVGAAYRREPLEPDEAVSQFNESLSAKVTVENRPKTQACYLWMGQTAMKDDVFCEAVHDMFVRRPALDPGYATEVAVRSLNGVLRKSDDTYPKARERLATWHDRRTLETVTQTDHYGDFYRDLGNDIATTQRERGKLLKAALLAYGLESPISFVEFGCSQNHIALKFAEHNQPDQPYTNTRLFLDFVPRIIGGREMLVPITDTGLSTGFNRAIREESLELKMAAGIDLRDPEDPEYQEWPLNCLYIEELADPNKVKDFQRFSRTKHHNVRAFRGDFSDPLDPVKFRAEAGQDAPLEYDAVFMSFSLYQLKDNDQLTQTIENAFKLVHDDGLVVIFDAVTILNDTEGGGTMVFLNNRTPYNPALWVCQKKDRQLGFNKLASTENGRVKRLKIEPGLFKTPHPERLGLPTG